MAQNLETRLVRLLLSAIDDYQLIFPGDRILVAFSGGKDNFSLFQLLQVAFSKNSTLHPSPIIYPVLIDLGSPATTRGEEIQLEKEEPAIKKNIFLALKNVKPEYLL